MKKPAAGKPAPPMAKPPGASPMRNAREEEAPAPARPPPAKGVPMFPGGIPKPGGKPTPPAVQASAPPPQLKKAAPPPVPKPKPKAPAPGGGSKARAQFAYQATRDDELSFNEGDLITVFAKNADGWWEGEAHGYRGVFPGNYVVEEAQKRVKAQWAYTAQRADELSFAENQIIVVLEEKGNWHRGEYNGKTGLYPANYVTAID